MDAYSRGRVFASSVSQVIFSLLTIALFRYSCRVVHICTVGHQEPGGKAQFPAIHMYSMRLNTHSLLCTRPFMQM